MRMRTALIAAMRGSADGGRWSQGLEVGGEVSNTLTTVRKDNLVIEVHDEEDDDAHLPQERVRGGGPQGLRGGTDPPPRRSEIREFVPRTDGIANTLTACPSRENLLVEVEYDGEDREVAGHRGGGEEAGGVRGGYIIDTQFDKVNYYPRVSPTVTTRFDANNCEFYIEPIERKEMETIMERETKEGDVLFKGREVHHGEGLYTGTTVEFFRGGLPDVSRCINAESNDAGVCLAEREGATRPRFRIRKLTEREAFRLMDVSESDIDKIQAAGISRSQQYKMAGNSIVTACMVGIFEKLFFEEETPTTLF